MTVISRRAAAFGAFSALTLAAACGNGIGSDGAATIDARVAATLDYMERTYPGTVDLRAKASGLLVMPLITEAGLGIGGSYGRGALVVDRAIVDYYSAAQASVGFQIGAQQYAHVLFFMTPEELTKFRTSSGWVAGANVEYAFRDTADSLLADTTTVSAPVIGIVFGQTGLRAGATVDGTKYTRIIP